MIWDKISWEIFIIDILWYGVHVVFSWLKRFYYSKVIIFWTCQTVSAILFFAFTHLSILQIIIYQKMLYWVNILWNHQQSSLQYSLSIEVFGQKYCDIYSFYHISCSQPLGVHNKSSVPTYMINYYQYPLIWNLTIVTAVSAVLLRPKRNISTYKFSKLSSNTSLGPLLFQL